jgi:predicted RNA-binding Zn-ribbon protein involved in translation (DUF1610 family)
VPLQVGKRFVQAIQQLVILAKQVNANAELPPDLEAETYRCPRCQQVVVITCEDLRLTEG